MDSPPVRSAVVTFPPLIPTVLLANPARTQLFCPQCGEIISCLMTRSASRAKNPFLFGAGGLGGGLRLDSSAANRLSSRACFCFAESASRRASSRLRISAALGFLATTALSTVFLATALLGTFDLVLTGISGSVSDVSANSDD